MSKNSEIISESNKLKALAGKELDKYVKNVLDSLKQDGVIKTFDTNRNFNHKNFNYNNQFLVNFLIETLNGKYILVRSSTSFRQDRAKIGFYDFEGVLNHSTFAYDIIATIYLVPDKELQNTTFISTRDKIRRKNFYSPATHLLTISEFVSFIEGYKYSTIQSIEKPEGEESVSNMTLKEGGSYYGRIGNQLERTLVTILSDNKLLDKYKNGIKENKYFDEIIGKIISEEKLLAEDLVEVIASNSVPLLQSGGNAKTDVILRIKTANRGEVVKTISIKNTKARKVSCHDYKSEDFIRVLDCSKEKLSEYLFLFQQYPSKKSFEESMPEGFSIEEFTRLLTKKRRIFIEWVITGEHDNFNLTVPDLQVSQYLLINTPEKFAFYNMKEYISVIEKKSSLTFGVPFGWTYPSKQRGKRIQLKLPIFLD